MENAQKLFNALTVGSVMLLAAAVSGAGLVYPGASAPATESFVGTTPDAAASEVEAPTF